jgi:hypothetical protein
MALDAITSAVPQEMLASLAVKKSITEAWEAVKSLRIGSVEVVLRHFHRSRHKSGPLWLFSGEGL